MTLKEKLGDFGQQSEINGVKLSDPLSRSIIELKERSPFVPMLDSSTRFLKIINLICYYKYLLFFFLFKAGEVGGKQCYLAISNLVPLLISGLTKQSFTGKYPPTHASNSRKIKSTSQRRLQIHRPALSSQIYF